MLRYLWRLLALRYLDHCSYPKRLYLLILGSDIPYLIFQIVYCVARASLLTRVLDQ